MKKIEDVVGNAVGAGADGEADDFGVGEGGFVERAKAIDGGVGVGGGLEVGNKMIDFVAVLEAADAVVELSEDFFAEIAPCGEVDQAISAAGAETAVVAEGAAAGGDRPIDVGACETGVEADFLDAAGTKLASQEKTVGVITMSSNSPRGRIIGDGRVCLASGQ